MDITIRPETSDDAPAIHALTRRAFATVPYADGDEQDLIDRLREAGALLLSLVAERDGAIVGQVTLSPATHETGVAGWLALGPVSAEPDLKHQGIGSALIRAAIDWMKAQGASGCILLGNPAYYGRFGFAVSPAQSPENLPGQYFQVLTLECAAPSGRFGFHPLFDGAP